MVVLRELPGQHNAQLGGVLAAADRRFGIIVQLLVDDGDAAGLRARAAAAADEHVDFGGIHILLLQHIQDDLVAEGNLAVDMGKLQQDRRVVEPAFAEDFLFVDKETDLGGCGTGIDNQPFIFHLVFPTSSQQNQKDRSLNST